MFNVGDIVYLKMHNITILEGEIVDLKDEYVIIHPVNAYRNYYLSAKIIRKKEKAKILKKDKIVFSIKNIVIEKYLQKEKAKIPNNNINIPDSAIHNWGFSENTQSENEIIDNFYSETEFKEVKENKWYTIETNNETITLSEN